MGQRTFEKARTLVRRGNKKGLKAMLKRRPELLSSKEAYLLYEAMWLNRGMFKWLLERGADPNTFIEDDYGDTCLMSAAAEGKIESMRLLLSYGADCELANDSSETAIGFACAWQQLPAIRLLAEHGANINSTLDSGGNKTLLDWAISCGWDGVANELRQLGAIETIDLK